MNTGGKAGLLWWLLTTPAFAQSASLGLLEVRLATPLTSYDSARQTEFRSVAIAPFRDGERIWIPAGTAVFGTVRHSTRVGIGIAHERASLDLDFTRYELPDGRSFPITATLVEIENAREAVTSSGQIKGILAAANPQSLLGGIWHRPRMSLFQHSIIGLTGLSGRIWSGYSMGPLGAGVLFTVRCLLFQMPEPEIQLPSGTEMRVRVTHIPADAPSFELEQQANLSDDLAEWLRAQPFVVTTKAGKDTADMINVAFLGSREQLKAAFEASGWFEASPRTARSVSQMYTAYSRQAGYGVAPTSRLSYQGADADLIFEKSFNTITKRHHVRIWRVEQNGSELWLGAATRDIGIAFRVSEMKFTHKIDSQIDVERSKIVNDIAFAGCADPAGYVDRPHAARPESNMNYTETDGRLAVIPLRASAGLREPDKARKPKPPLPMLLQIARRIVLEGRQYMLRENPYYWAYRAVAWRRQDSRDRQLVAHD